ncbi:polyribonucleotide nucleotidyltransferase [Nitzschia inconspicua]|uniref:polyribonucleotide nucleotidyltransferase n=1 Tax=Nitzschia inconspicua TaxID=303405 RepID=A0A9K3PMJ6_9STRA|nr:polyribonucleotide nucleotidyltransferase [Nitzschia inconspicua]
MSCKRSTATPPAATLLLLVLLAIYTSFHLEPISGFQLRNLRLTYRSSSRDTQQTKTSATSATSLASSYYAVENDNSGPGGSEVHRLIINSLPGQKDDNEHGNPIVIETGKIGRQAAGAVTLTRGDTVLYATASRDESPKEGLDFLPLSVEHQERFSAVGMTSGGYNKRDGRPAEHEVLTCRLIDRPLRPLIADGWRHETQLLSWVLSYDGSRSCDPLAIIASSTALYLSDIPLTKAVAAAMVGYDSENDQLILNPTHKEMETSDLQLIVAGTKDAVLMIEGAANFLPEKTMTRAVKFGHDAIRAICEAVEDLGHVMGVEKKFDTLLQPPEGLQERVDELMTEKVDAMFALGGTKTTQGPVKKKLQNELIEALSVGVEDDVVFSPADIKNAFKDLLCRRMFHLGRTTGKRCDGRALDEIRHLSMDTGILPRVHGSALFTRGETQVVASTTLGDSGMRQKIDKIDGLEEKRFYLQYTFPPSCVGETGRVGAPGRREIGHGNLAERALIPTLPKEEDFPYTIRVESLVTESHGSSSMASVCGGCLALMDAGVPIKNPVAGIAMGMLLGDKDGVSDDNAVILSDILGTEDALGTMDFKVAGDRTGITTFQLDIKCEGLSLETMERALEQARKGRLHILDAMDAVLPKARDSLPATVPKLLRFSVPPDSIGKIIGPGGKQIRAIIEDFELTNMDVNDDGNVQVSSFNAEKLAEVEEFVKLLLSGPAGGKGKREERPEYKGPEPVEGEIYMGKITGIHPFGVFLEFMPGAEDGSYPGLEGLCHISQLAKERVRSCEGYVKSLNTDQFEVKYLGISDAGKRQLSRKDALPGGGGGGNSSRPPRKNGAAKEAESSSPSPTTAMSEDELDVIAQAIQGVQEL